jgi:hypothetical protein
MLIADLKLQEGKMAKSQTADMLTPTNSQWEQMPIQKIATPGCYVDRKWGHLYRVTPEMLNIGGTVFYGFTSNEPWYVTKISNDYTLPLDECRILTANASIPVNF